jgi:bla regulator protein blaR1
VTPLLTVLAIYSAQVLILIGVAALAATAVRLALPSARLAYWRAVLVLCLLLPAGPDFKAAGPAASVTFEVLPGAVGPAVAGGVTWTTVVLAAVPWLVAAGAVSRLLWLAAGAFRLRRLRRRSDAAPLDASLEELHRAVAPTASVRRTDDLTQPVTFGWRRPIVLLPPRFATLSAEAQHAVLCHELLHVQRRDWPAIVCEELLRSVLWFHPAVWWALDQVHLSREQLVDRLVVARTASRRAYMDALVHFADAPDGARPAIAFLRRRHLASRIRQLSKEPHMTRLRLASAAAALVFVMSGTAAAVVSALPLNLPALGLQGGPTSLEIRLAELQPGPGLREAALDSGQRIYMRPEAVVTGADVTRADIVDAGGRYSISVAFGVAASNRLAEATQVHLGKPIAIVLDGKVIAAPTVRSMIRGSAVITGDFTRTDAERIASGLRPPAAASAAPVAQRYTGKDAGVVLPKVVSDVRPRYTQAAMDAKIQGDVELSVVVRADGSIGEVTVVTSLDATHGLDDAAVDAVRQWTFNPGAKDGKAVDVEIHIQMRFTLI